MLRDKADADVLDLSKSTAGNRYMKIGASMADDVMDRHERAHLDISRKERHDLDAKASQVHARD